jgi:hypothetical protein
MSKIISALSAALMFSSACGVAAQEAKPPLRPDVNPIVRDALKNVQLNPVTTSLTALPIAPTSIPEIKLGPAFTQKRWKVFSPAWVEATRRGLRAEPDWWASPGPDYEPWYNPAGEWTGWQAPLYRGELRVGQRWVWVNKHADCKGQCTEAIDHIVVPAGLWGSGYGEPTTRPTDPVDRDGNKIAP